MNLNRTLIKQSLDDWNEVYLQIIQGFITRDVGPLPPKGSSATLLGARRSGKTYQAVGMTRQLRPEAVLYYNFEDPLYYAHPDVENLDLLLSVAEEYRREPIDCLVLDEIQNVDGWERWLRKLIALKRYHIIVTGSSAKLLSSELATALAGRTLADTVWPLSLEERLRFAGTSQAADRRRLAAEVRQCLTWGAFPEVVLEPDDQRRRRLLQQYLSDIVLRDVITRHQIRNKRALDQILTYYLTNPSSPHSYTAVGRAFGIATDTVADYTAALQDAFCVFEVLRYHPNLKVQARDPRKVYIVDPGLRAVGARSVEDDTGKLLENLVYLELRRRGCEVSYYQGRQEVDFVVTEHYQPRAAIQVCAAGLDQPATFRREVDALLECLGALNLDRGVVVTLDEEQRLSEQGKSIELVPARRWLLGA
jgi:hypothetical protein